MQEKLQDSGAYVRSLMKLWAVTKVCGIKLPGKVTQDTSALTDKDHGRYFGLSLGVNEVTCYCLVEHIKSAIHTFMTLIPITK